MPSDSLWGGERGTEARQAFWKWFELTVLPVLVSDEPPLDEVRGELDERLLSLGVSWELGPAGDGSDDWVFCISFGGAPEKVPLAMLLVNAAGAMPGCQVSVGKPPKQWDGELEIHWQSRRLRFSTARWICRIRKIRERVALGVVPVGIGPGVEREAVAEAASIAVQSELGELATARQIESISICELEREESAVGVACTMSRLRASLQAMGVVT